MSKTLSRGFATDLTIDGRTIVGLAVPFNKVALVSDGGRPYKESFQRGAFAVTIKQRGDKVRAQAQHNSDWLPIGKAVHLEETDRGLETHLRISATSGGNDVLALVRDGVMNGLSIGFRSIKHNISQGVTVRTEAALSEISVVNTPAYAEAQISGIRMNHDLDIEDLVEEKIRELIASQNLDPATASMLESIEVVNDSLQEQSVPPIELVRLRARLLFEGII